MMTASDATILVATYLATVGTTRPILQPVLQSKFVSCPLVPEARNTPAHAFVVSTVGLGTESVAVCDGSMQPKSQLCLPSSKATRDQIAGGLLVTVSSWVYNTHHWDYLL